MTMQRLFVLLKILPQVNAHLLMWSMFLRFCWRKSKFPKNGKIYDPWTFTKMQNICIF